MDLFTLMPGGGKKVDYGYNGDERLQGSILMEEKISKWASIYSSETDIYMDRKFSEISSLCVFVNYKI